jgi:uncharacterized protein
MIIDCHTHIWQSPDQLGAVDLGELSMAERRAMHRVSPSGKVIQRLIPSGDPDLHMQQTQGIDKTIILGFRSKYLNAGVPNDFVAGYVRRDPSRLIGFAGIDPTEAGALDDLLLAHEKLGLRGVAVSPAGQDFHPADTRAMRLFAKCDDLKMPVVFHPGGLMNEQSKLEFGRPFLIDEVARNFPNLRIVIAQMGQPWIDETVVLLGKHRHVFADISGLLIRPWPGYNALVSAHQYGVIDKLLFGSDFPYIKPADCIEALYSINTLVQGTNLPVVPREALRGIVERDTLELLGLE